jgi:N-acyl-D-aspartate/D-glutamate deacylase
VSVAEAIDIGVDQVEHLLHSPELLPPDEARRADVLPSSAWGSLEMFRLWRYVDPAGPGVRRLLDRMAAAGVVLAPTLALSAAVLNGPSSEHAERGRTSAIPVEVLRRWEDTAHPEQYSADDVAEAPRILELQLEHVRLAREAGVRLAAGTGGMGHYLHPGASLLDELELLVVAGLSPAEALVAGTRTAAESVGQGGHIGTITPGARADVVVLDADPRVDINNVRTPVAVLKEGEVVAGKL